MSTTTTARRFKLALACLLLGLAMTASYAQQAAAPLPEGYLRAPTTVPAGGAPKMRVVEATGPTHVFTAYFREGDELLSGLTDLAIAKGITEGSITGLGGVSSALLVWGDPVVGAFKTIPIDERGELVLNGHIQLRDGKPVVHLHAVLSVGDGSTKAGHVFEARVQPLAEITIVATGVVPVR
jgi:predicted DNA-binding protein with PD1-like motif